MFQSVVLFTLQTRNVSTVGEGGSSGTCHDRKLKSFPDTEQLAVTGSPNLNTRVEGDIVREQLLYSVVSGELLLEGGKVGGVL